MLEIIRKLSQFITIALFRWSPRMLYNYIALYTCIPKFDADWTITLWLPIVIARRIWSYFSSDLYSIAQLIRSILSFDSWISTVLFTVLVIVLLPANIIIFDPSNSYFSRSLSQALAAQSIIIIVRDHNETEHKCLMPCFLAKLEN